MSSPVENGAPSNGEKERAHFDENDILRQEQNFIDYYTGKKVRPIRLLLKLYRGHYGKLLLSALFFTIKTSPVWVLPIVAANIINIAAAGTPDTVQGIVFWVLLELFLILLNIPTHYLHIRFLSLATRSVEAGLRGAMVRKLQQLSITFHKEMESGRIQSKIMRDVEAIEGLSSQVFVSGLNIVINLLVALSVVLCSNLTVFAFFVLCAPAAAITGFAFHRRMRETNRDFRREIERTSADVMNMVELIPVTRAHALEHREVRRMTSRLNNVAEKGYRVDLTQSMFGSVSWCVFQFFQLLCLGATAYMAYKKIIGVGDIVMYQSYFGTLVGQISALLGLLPTLTRGTESIGSVGEILSAHDIENNTGKRKLTHLDGAYSFRNVSFGYTAEDDVLTHFNLDIHQGETVALVGESGAGKSTVLNILIGFNTVHNGTITVDGIDINTIDLHSYRKFIAVVPQTSVLFPGTIRDNITYGTPNISEDKLWEAVKAANLEKFVSGLPDGLDTLINEHGGNLSGGQRQRISIARAIIRDPRVIILDEATSALDSVSEKEIQHAIRNLTRDRTTFIVAHRLSTIRDADKIAVLEKGYCIEYGTYDELMAKKGAFYRFKSMQS